MSASTQQDPGFGPMAIRLGHASPGQVQECLGVQLKMREMGVEESLGEIMVKKGHLTPDQLRAVLKALGVHTSPIPGYSIIAKVGQGGMGTVYKAEQSSVHRAVAIKVMSSLATEDKTFVVRFIKEAEAAGKLNHPNIISVIDAGEANGTYYFVMEFVDGRTTRELVQTRGRFDEKTAVDIAVQVAKALDYIHKHKMIHRDIKPENILLTVDGTAKLGDFGLAKSTAGTDQSLTQTGFAVGTPYTMSPEQVRGERDVDIRADLYSLGASLYYWVAGRFVFEGKTAAETMAMHLKEAPADPRKHGAHVSDSLIAVIMKCLEKDRARRYQSPGQLLEDLDRVRRGESLHHSRVGPGLTKTKRKVVAAVHGTPPRTGVAVPVGLAAALLAAIVAVVILSGSNQRVEPATSGGETVRKEDGTTDPVEPVKNPGDDATKLKAASALWAEAENHIENKRWSEARDTFDRLTKEFGALDYVVSKTAEIGEKRRKCELAIKERGEFVAKKRNEADEAMARAQWAEAQKFLKELKDAGEKVDADIDRCAREMKAVKGMEVLVDHVLNGRWTAVLVQAQSLRDEYGDTVTVRKEREAIRGFETQAQMEIEAEKAYVRLFEVQAKGTPKDLSDALAKFAKTYYNTQTYKDHETEIGEMRRTLITKDQEAEESRAQAAWDQASRDYRTRLGERKYQEAADALAAWEKTWGHTREYGKRKAELATLHDNIDKARVANRNSDAVKLWESAKTAFSKSQWDDAMRAYDELLTRYADTPTVKANESTIRKNRTRCEDELGLSVDLILKVDFEPGCAEWDVRGDSKPAPSAGFSDEAHQGKRSSKIVFPAAASGEWSAVTFPVKGVGSGKADCLTFYAKSARKGVNPVLKFQVVEEFRGGWERFEVTLPAIGGEWKKVTVKFSDFKFEEGNGGNKTFDPQNLVRFGFLQDRRDSAAEILVDTVRIESPRK